MAQYRYSHTFAEQLSVQVGAFGSLQRSFSSLYPGITLLTFNVAQFAQMEWARSGWKLAAGVRNESNLNPGVFDETSGPILRFGLNRQLTPTTNVRLSYGESLRFASLAERYVEGSITDGVSIRGNLDLISESGNNVELGLIQRLESDAGNLLLEGAAFVLNYDEMIEYTLLPELDANGWIQTDDSGNPLFSFSH